MKWQKECPRCGKIYKSKRFYELHVKKYEEEKTEELRIKELKKVKYREVIYLGIADKAIIRGKVTDKIYKFLKDKYNMPISTKVDEKDYPSIITLKGKGCIRRDPAALYMSKYDWNLEIEAAKAVNR